MNETRIWNPDIKPTEVKADDEYRLHIKFCDDVSVVYDVSHLLDKGLFTKLRDKTFFKQAHISYGTVVWNDVLDLAPETLYEDSTLV
jgi:hypothetical protein